MISMQVKIENKIKELLQPEYLKVVNESMNHSGDAQESHFKLVIVSDYFIDMSLINRHRIINKLFKQEMQEGIHALAIHTYTVSEWEKRRTPPESPLCKSK